MEKLKEEIKADVVEDETELDKVLEESIESVKAGNELAPEVEAKVEEPKVETPEVPKPEDSSTPPVDEVKSEELVPGPTGPGETGPGETGPGETGPPAYEFRVPNKGKFESDESFEKRIELLDLVKQRKLAKTDEQRQLISEDIKKAKSQIKNLNGTDRFINPLNEKPAEAEPKPGEVEDAALTADKERLKELGGATKEDIEAMVQKQTLATAVKTTLDTFVERHTELGDEDTREVFFDFVDSNYAWQNKSGKELMTVLELARESMFKPSETVQERVLKGANVQEKVNAMQFPGGTVAKTDFSPEMRKDLDEIIATGVSEEKAIELLSD